MLSHISSFKCELEINITNRNDEVENDQQNLHAFFATIKRSHFTEIDNSQQKIQINIYST